MYEVKIAASVAEPWQHEAGYYFLSRFGKIIDTIAAFDINAPYQKKYSLI